MKRKFIAILLLSIVSMISCSSNENTKPILENIGKEQSAYFNPGAYNAAWLSNAYMTTGSWSAGTTNNLKTFVVRSVNEYPVNFQVHAAFINGGSVQSDGTLPASAFTPGVPLQILQNISLNARNGISRWGMDPLVWLNGLFCTSGSPNCVPGDNHLDLSDPVVQNNLSYQCAQYLLTTDELNANPLTTGLGLTSFVAQSVSQLPNGPYYTGGKMRFSGCMWDLESDNGEAHDETLMANYQQVIYKTSQILNPTTLNYQQYMYGGYWVNSPTNNYEWSSFDIENFISNGATGFAPGLYSGITDGSNSCDLWNGSVVCGAPLNNALNNYFLWEEQQMRWWAESITWGLSPFNITPKYFINVAAQRINGCSYSVPDGTYQGLPKYRYSCNHDPNVENTYWSSAGALYYGVPYMNSFVPGLSNTITGAAVFAEFDGSVNNSNFANYAAVSSTNPNCGLTNSPPASCTWHDWPDYCSQWLGVNCNNFH